MQEVVTDVTANDGQWHHICVTWSSPTGAWNILFIILNFIF